MSIQRYICISIDVFFSSKDGTLPVTLELRTVENGYPTEQIILGSQVTLNPDDIVISLSTATSPEPTRFTFDRPIFLGQISIQWFY